MSAGSLALVAGTFVVVASTLVLEAVRSSRHERRRVIKGAVAPPGDVYRWMTAAYPASFLAMLGEGVLREPRADLLFAIGVAVFSAAKALKYWAIAVLGERWTFKVLTLHGETLVSSGPYRYLRHPNYVAVVGELVGVALVMRAGVTGVLAMVGFGTLLWRRIAIEERALGMR